MNACPKTLALKCQQYGLADVRLGKITKWQNGNMRRMEKNKTVVSSRGLNDLRTATASPKQNVSLLNETPEPQKQTPKISYTRSCVILTQHYKNARPRIRTENQEK